VSARSGAVLAVSSVVGRWQLRSAVSGTPYSSSGVQGLSLFDETETTGPATCKSFTVELQTSDFALRWHVYARTQKSFVSLNACKDVKRRLQSKFDRTFGSFCSFRTELAFRTRSLFFSKVKRTCKRIITFQHSLLPPFSLPSNERYSLNFVWSSQLSVLYTPQSLALNGTTVFQYRPTNKTKRTLSERVLWFLIRTHVQKAFGKITNAFARTLATVQHCVLRIMAIPKRRYSEDSSVQCSTVTLTVTLLE